MDLEKLVRRMTLREKLAQLTQIRVKNYAPFLGVPYPEGQPQDVPERFSDCLPGTVPGSVSAESAAAIQRAHLMRDRLGIPLLFMQDHFGSTIRPVRKLIAFGALDLLPGEEKELRFTVEEKDLAVWTADDRCEAEPGAFTLYAGPLEADFTLSR